MRLGAERTTPKLVGRAWNPSEREIVGPAARQIFCKARGRLARGDALRADGDRCAGRAIQPGLLTQLARDAIATFFDATLAWRAEQIRSEWREAGQRAVDEQSGGEQSERLRIDAAAPRRVALPDQRGARRGRYRSRPVRSARDPGATGAA